ncbi:MAG TPA: hypothetical protein VFI25_07120 [Planctomycetota bacterium]|jgi:hypothetical protein|nr:hypothetical protein [Planctomycetota bacterium]
MRNPFLCALAVGGIVVGAVVHAADEPKKASPLDRIKALAGDWVRVGEDGKPTAKVVSSYKVTAAGSAVVETMLPGSAHEMVTVYHMDGEQLMLTHYCAQGNQPRMKAKPGGSADRIEFSCAGVTNLKSEDDPHMHAATFIFLGPDRLRSEWQFFDKGKCTETAKFDVARKN